MNFAALGNLIGIVLVFALAGLLLMWFSLQSFESFSQFVDNRAAGLSLSRAGEVAGYLETWMTNIPEWLVVMSGVGIVLSLVFHGWIARHKVPVQAAFALWIVAVLVVKRPNATPKVWSFLLAFLLMWAAAGLVELFKKLPFLARGTGLSKALLVGVMGLLCVNDVLIAPIIPSIYTPLASSRGAFEIYQAYASTSPP